MLTGISFALECFTAAIQRSQNCVPYDHFYFVAFCDINLDLNTKSNLMLNLSLKLIVPNANS